MISNASYLQTIISDIVSFTEADFSGVLLALGIFWTVYLLNEVLLLRKRYRGACYIQDAESAAKRYEYWVQGVKNILLIFILLAENVMSILGIVISAIPDNAFHNYPVVIITSYIISIADFGIFLLNILILFLIEVYNNRTQQLPYKVKACLVFSVAKLGLFTVLSGIPPLAVIVHILLVLCIIANVVWCSCNSFKLLAALNWEHVRIRGEDAVEAQKMRHKIIEYKRFTVLLIIGLVILILYTITASLYIFTQTIHKYTFNNFFLYEITFPQGFIVKLTLIIFVLQILMSGVFVFVVLPVIIFPYIIITCLYIYRIIKKRMRCRYGNRNGGDSTLEQKLIKH